MVTIKTDSRKIQPGDIFVALDGFQSNGHDYISNAIRNGATKIIVSREGDYSVPSVLVEDTRQYLVHYLKEHYNHVFQDMVLIGVTGTNGKTTSGYLLYQALNKLGTECGYIGTIGYYLKEKVSNLPNTTVEIADLYDMIVTAYEQGYRYMVLELSSHALDYGRVGELEFDYAIFTNLTNDHLDYHKTMENYAIAKQILFRHVKSGGKSFVNFDDPYKRYFLLEENNNLTYGFEGGDYQVIAYEMNHLETVFTYQHNHEIKTIHTSILGKYNIYNILATIMVLEQLSYLRKEIEQVIKELKTPPGRMDTILYKSNSIIIDYAHTPDAMDNIIRTMKEITTGDIYTVFGCTGDRDRVKRPIMLRIATTLSKHVIITNDDPHFEDPNQIVNDMIEGVKEENYEVCLDRKEAIQRGVLRLKENDVLLILGKGHEEFMIIGQETIPFNDRKVVIGLLNEMIPKI